ncbi:MAG: response regulator transcription factor [Actinomycetota bacterium]
MARICVAEDDADIRNVIAFTLLDGGHEVLAVKDGRAALDAVSSENPDILVLDLMLPEMDGLEVLDTLESKGLRAGTRVLVVSARSSEQDRLVGFEHGADLYLAKPFDPVEFLQAVGDLLESSPEALQDKRQQERDRSALLAQLENVFPDANPMT